MRTEMIPRRWLEYEPPGLCHGLETLGLVASIGGTVFGAIGKANEAEYQQKLAQNQAEALRIRANDEAAAAQRVQITEERKTRLLQSRARALSASSGTLASDPTQVDIEQDIAQQGGYNALSALYEGMAAARASRHQADIELFKGERAAAAAPLAIGGTLLSGLSSFGTQYSRLYSKAR